MRLDEIGARLRVFGPTLGIGAMIEAVVDVILVAGLLVAAVSAPGAIAKVLAAVAAGLIVVGWAFRRRHSLRRRSVSG